MIENFKYYILVLVLAAFSSCAVDALQEYPADRVAAVLTSGIGTIDGQTRAANNAWGATDEVGVYALAASGTVGTTLPGLKGDGTLTAATDGNYRYKAVPVDGSENKRAKLTPYDAANTVYYPVDNTPMHFIAYHPYLATASLKSGYKYPVNVTSDQSTVAKQAAVDLLYYKNTAVTGYRKEPEVALQFAHQLSKIVVKVSKNETMDDISLESLSVKFSGMPTTADFVLANGALDNQGTVADIVPLKKTATATSHIAEVIIPPHDNTGDAFQNRTMTFELATAGLKHTYNMPDAHSFEKGIVYTYNMTLTRTGVDFEGATISDWGSTVTSGLGDDCVMKVSRSKLYFSSEGTTKYSLIVKTNLDEPVVTFMDGDDASTANTITWISKTQAGLNEYDEQDGLSVYELLFNVSAGSDATGYIHITSDKPTSGTYSRVVEVIRHPEDAKNTEQVIEQQKSNCYIIHPYGHGIAIPISRANDHEAGAIGAGDGLTAELMWSDVAGSNGKAICSDGGIASIATYGTGATGYLIVHPGNIEGNAVVAVKVGGVIKWSWHIWTTSFDPEREKKGPFNNFYFMDRNLGAVNKKDSPGLPGIEEDNGETKGLFYQWGRKDPFPRYDKWYAGVEVPVYDADGLRAATGIVTGTKSLAWAIQNPDAFVTEGGSAVMYDWLDVQNDYLWFDGSTDAKTIYDPCPVGWRIAPVTTKTIPWYGPWNGVIQGDQYVMENQYRDFPYYKVGNDRKGRLHAVIGWYPAAGSKNGMNGKFDTSYDVSYGRYWSNTCTFYQNSGVYSFATNRLSFCQTFDNFYLNPNVDGKNGGQASTNQNTTRSTGASIRCVKQ